jgi:hypothetical protein
VALHPRFKTHTVGELVSLYDEGRLELAPQFQRNSVWKSKDRALLIESILFGMPIPAIFLYERRAGTRTKFDVIDGKQRLETILAFVGSYDELVGGPLEVRISKNREDGSRTPWLYEDLKAIEKRRFEGFRVPVVVTQPDNGLGEVIDLFVRLNSTGKRLTGMERRKAQFFESPTLNRIQNYAIEFLPYLKELGVVSTTDAERMVHIELTLELLLSLEQHGPLDKKKAIDKMIAGEQITGATLKSCAAHLRAALKDISGMWDATTRADGESLRWSRFTNKSDFYSMALFLAMRHEQGSRMLAPNRKVAADLLIGFDYILTEVAHAQKTFAPMPTGSKQAVQYLTTVKEGTDTRKHRQDRARLLGEILTDDVLTPLSTKRRFDATQKRLLWYRSSRRCECCSKGLAFNEVEIDHIVPYSQGGATNAKNGQILCKHCNTTKGAGRKCLH